MIWFAEIVNTLMMDFVPSTELSNYGIAKLLAESMKCGMRKIKFGLMAKSFIRNKLTMTRFQLEHTEGVNNVFAFGKFKGKTILQVIDANPSYIVWCIRNVQGFSLDKKLEKELCKQYDEHFRRYELAKANGYTSNDVNRLMSKPYNMHVTEAMNYLEYDAPEYY